MNTCMRLVARSAMAAAVMTAAMSMSAGCGAERAVVDGVPITEADADDLRALLQPAPSVEAARRLALDAALAHRLLRGHLAASSAKARRDAYRELLVVLKPGAKGPIEHAEKTVAVLEEAKRRFQDGASGAEGASGASVVELPRAQQRAEDAAVRYELVHVFVADGGDARVLQTARAGLAAGETPAELELELEGRARVETLKDVTLADLQLAIADAVAGAKEGETLPAVRTANGGHVVKLVHRDEKE